jgi:hypothetical protein
MDGLEQHARLAGARRPPGNESRTLVVGGLGLRIDGLSADLCESLERRWGGFLIPPGPQPSHYTVELYRAGAGYWIGAPLSGEAYRVEAVNDESRRLVWSYHFAIGRGVRPGNWRVGLSDQADEPLERVLDNALRYLTAYLAVEQGGFAMHAAGVLHEDRAWLFAGASRAGKSTVVQLLEPADSLGDDFGMVLPLAGGGWSAPAVPFDNAERIGSERPTGKFPLAGVWRLHQAGTTYVELPPAGRAVTSLMGCTAFSWAMPEQAAKLLEQVERFVGSGMYQHLHFTKDASLWSVLI